MPARPSIAAAREPPRHAPAINTSVCRISATPLALPRPAPDEVGAFRRMAQITVGLLGAARGAEYNRPAAPRIEPQVGDRLGFGPDRHESRIVERAGVDEGDALVCKKCGGVVLEQQRPWREVVERLVV